MDLTALLGGPHATENIIAVLVAARVARDVFNHFVHNPRKQAQADAILETVNKIAGQLAQKEGGS